MQLRPPRSPQELTQLVCEVGFLPFFDCGIPGFSIEACCPKELWFSDSADGPWEWKGPVAKSGACLYGKFFGGKAGFVSLPWFWDFANYRRDGYDFDARYDEGLAPHRDKTVFDRIEAAGDILSKHLKKQLQNEVGTVKGFDTVITRLQMQTYVCISDFDYLRDRFGKPYGWGVARYSTPEALYGNKAMNEAYRRSPMASKARILDHLHALLPEAGEKQLLNIIG